MGAINTGAAAFAHPGGYGLMGIPPRFAHAAFLDPFKPPPKEVSEKINFVSAPDGGIRGDVFVSTVALRWIQTRHH